MSTIAMQLNYDSSDFHGRLLELEVNSFIHARVAPRLGKSIYWLT